MTAVLVVSLVANIGLAYMLFDSMRMCESLIDDGFWMMSEIIRLEKELADHSGENPSA